MSVWSDESETLSLQRTELHDLQRKSPEDLWKEDLAVFIEELDVSFICTHVLLNFIDQMKPLML